mgnify:CR=1 FL=1
MEDETPDTGCFIIVFVILYMVLMMTCFDGHAQCPNDVCEDAIEVEQQTNEAFCNYDCNEDFNQYWQPGWNNALFPCTYRNYDQWYLIEVQVGGMIQFHFESDYNTIEEIGQDGQYEGIDFDIWEGDNCNDISFLWGTGCHWQTGEVYYINPPEFDPSRREWNFTIDLDAGFYYINIDGFGYSVGCGEWWWSEPYFLGLWIGESVKGKTVKDRQKYNVLGQSVR